jgi:prolyl 4-hydroxylase
VELTGETYKDSVENRRGGHEHRHDGIPDYILPDTEEERKWINAHPKWKPPNKNVDRKGATTAHKAAANGDMKTIAHIIRNDKELIHKKDANGWSPLHEGVRGGHFEVVKHLVENGADVNEITGHDGQKGVSSLYLAIDEHGEDHPIVEFLESVGALMIGPEL